MSSTLSSSCTRRVLGHPDGQAEPNGPTGQSQVGQFARAGEPILGRLVGAVVQDARATDRSVRDFRAIAKVVADKQAVTVERHLAMRGPGTLLSAFSFRLIHWPEHPVDQSRFLWEALQVADAPTWAAQVFREVDSVRAAITAALAKATGSRRVPAASTVPG